jgi:tRNA threonylcarbamoyladenosine biosynthesis protein TsaB
LCFALDIPLIAVNTLETLAAQAKINEGLIIPMIDARRMEVYSAILIQNLKKSVKFRLK